MIFSHFKSSPSPEKEFWSWFERHESDPFDGYSEDERRIFENIGYLYLDQALGEHTVEMLVGFIEFHSRESVYFDQARPLAELQDHFDEYWSRVSH